MLVQRAVIALTMGPLALFLIYLGGWFYFLPVAVFLLIAAVEFVKITQAMGWRPSLFATIPPVLLLLILGNWYEPEWMSLGLAVGLLLVMGYALWMYERRLSDTVLADWMAMMTAVVLVGWVGSHFFRLRGLEEMAWQWTMLAMLSTWFSDSAAYLVGRFMAGNYLLGRHAMSPRLSPNKTMEGYGGGIVLGTGLTVLVGYWFGLPLTAVFILGLFVSVITPVGDLGISLLKREAGVKDSGALFPGHGGALDRIDSLMWAVAFTYYLALLFS